MLVLRGDHRQVAVRGGEIGIQLYCGQQLFFSLWPMVLMHQPQTVLIAKLGIAAALFHKLFIDRNCLDLSIHRHQESSFVAQNFWIFLVSGCAELSQCLIISSLRR